MRKGTQRSNILVACLAAALVGRSAFAAVEPQADARTLFSAHRGRDGLVVEGSADRLLPATRQENVDAAWDGGAIRFTFKSADGRIFTTDAFERIDGRRATSVLGRAVATELDIPGVYRAEVRAGSGAAVGWLRVSVSSFDVPSRRYDGDVPAALTREMIRTAVGRLDADIDWIEAHATDVHVGS